MSKGRTRNRSTPSVCWLRSERAPNSRRTNCSPDCSTRSKNSPPNLNSRTTSASWASKSNGWKRRGTVARAERAPRPARADCEQLIFVLPRAIVTMSSMPDAYEQLLDAAIQHLETLKAAGVRHVPVSPETLASLTQPAPPAELRSSRPVLRSSTAEGGREEALPSKPEIRNPQPRSRE